VTLFFFTVVFFSKGSKKIAQKCSQEIVVVKIKDIGIPEIKKEEAVSK